MILLEKFGSIFAKGSLKLLIALRSLRCMLKSKVVILLKFYELMAGLNILPMNLINIVKNRE